MAAVETSRAWRIKLPHHYRQQTTDMTDNVIVDLTPTFAIGSASTAQPLSVEAAGIAG